MTLKKNVSAIPLKRHITGQGMTEYIIIVALIAIAAVTAVGFFGHTVKAQFAQLGDEMVGRAAVTAESKVGARPNVDSASTLGNYGN